MKGKISLKEFIQEVKEELRASVNDADPFFIIGDVELEVCFELEIEGGAKAKLVVAEIGTKAAGKQLHRATIKLTPFVKKTVPAPAPPKSPTTPGQPAKPVKPAAGTVLADVRPRAGANIRRPVAKNPGSAPSGGGRKPGAKPAKA